MRFLQTAIILILIPFGLGQASNTVYLSNSQGDTIWANSNFSINIGIANDRKWMGMSTGFKIWSPDGATWTWENMGNAGYGTQKYVTVFANSRMSPVASVWDFGFMVFEQNLTAPNYDSILIGGVANAGGLPAGVRQDMIALNFSAAGPGDSTTHWLCLDSAKIGEGGEWVFADTTGMTSAPTVGWSYGGVCWPVRTRLVAPNEPPVFANCPTQPIAVNLCGVGVDTLHATDTENDPMTFSIVSTTGSGVAVIDGGSGLLMYTPGFPGDVGKTIGIVVKVTDSYHVDGNTCTIHFTITTTGPVLDCGAAYQSVAVGDTIVKSDIYGHTCIPVFFDMVSGPGRIDSLSGVYSWATTAADVGLHHVVIMASNQYGADTCGFDVDVVSTESKGPIEVTIQYASNALQGHYVNLNITQTQGATPIGGFDFLIAYDATVLTFTEASPGDLFSQCGWEYFTYRFGPNGNCNTGCPSGIVRIVALAETNDNQLHHPSCLMRPVPFTLATLKFLVTNDRAFECQFVPVRFFWYDCGDNTVSNPSGDTLYLSRHVYDYGGVGTYVDITDNNLGFPSYYGASDSCLLGSKMKPQRFVDFRNGGVGIICEDSIDARGDINVNGIANEIADVVMYIHYFIEGTSAFGTHVQASIAASDVNDDGLVLTIADMVYQVRVIVGDAGPYPVNGSENVQFDVHNGSVNYTSSANIGATLLVFHVKNAGEPVLGDGAQNMDIAYAVNGDEMRVLVYNIGAKAIAMGDHNLLSLSGDSVVLVSVEAADYYGNTMTATIMDPTDVTNQPTGGIPKTYALNQNYPNPFNPTTQIAFDVPRQCDVTLDVFNIMGQKIATLVDRPMAPGSYRATWNGADISGRKVSSGTYFYRLRAGDFVATKKMVLLK